MEEQEGSYNLLSLCTLNINSETKTSAGFTVARITMSKLESDVKWQSALIQDYMEFHVYQDGMFCA